MAEKHPRPGAAASRGGLSERAALSDSTPTPSDDIDPRQRLEALIERLQFKDMEIVEAVILVNRALVTGRPAPATVLSRLKRGRLLGTIESADSSEGLPATIARRFERIQRRYRAFREDLIGMLESHARLGSLNVTGYQATMAEAYDLMSEMENVKSDFWDVYAATDELTGLLNRTALEFIVERESRRGARLRESHAVALLDLDHFKAVNDTYGHDVGDRALVHLADLVSEDLRAVDYAVRLGGEEIALILPRTKPAQAMKACERLRKLIQESPLRLDDGQEIPLTASIGLANWRPGQAFETALKLADEAVYQAKGAGRNQVRLQRRARLSADSRAAA